jgi:hypothetical protein
MRNFLIVALMLMSSSNIVSAANETHCRSNPNVSVVNLPQPAINMCAIAVEKNKDQFQLAGQGCCSSHGGECGCTITGAVQCCDGRTSPSCGC